jgi:PHD/YefM family antitoxin component YafN of YafNO toxin-antitoxin module
VYENGMTIHISAAYARANLARLMNQVSDAADVVYVKRKNGKQMVMLPAVQLEQMQQELIQLQTANL